MSKYAKQVGSWKLEVKDFHHSIPFTSNEFLSSLVRRTSVSVRRKMLSPLEPNVNLLLVVKNNSKPASDIPPKQVLA